jgi:hypothetical protein
LENLDPDYLPITQTCSFLQVYQQFTSQTLAFTTPGVDCINIYIIPCLKLLGKKRCQAKFKVMIAGGKGKIANIICFEFPGIYTIRRRDLF